MKGGSYEIDVSVVMIDSENSLGFRNESLVTMAMPNGAVVPVAHVVAGASGPVNAIPLGIRLGYEFEPDDYLTMRIADYSAGIAMVAMVLRRVG